MDPFEYLIAEMESTGYDETLFISIVCSFKNRIPFLLKLFFIMFSFQINLEGHAAEVYDIKYKASTNQVLATSEDKTAKIFKLDLQMFT